MGQGRGPWAGAAGACCGARAWAEPAPGPGPGGARAKIYFPPMGCLTIDFCDDFAVVCAPFAPNNLISVKCPNPENNFDQNRCDSEIGVIQILDDFELPGMGVMRRGLS